MIQINGVDELDDFILNNIDNSVVVLYFGANWCQPCKLLKSKLEEEDTKSMMPRLAVCYLDVDLPENEKLCEQYNAESLPTQVFIKLDEEDRVEEVSRIEGFNFNKLKTQYDNYVNGEQQISGFE
jgi:thiol:disulfide interchange protein